MPHHPDRRPTRTARSLNAGNVEFFMEFVDKAGRRGCWTWLGRKNDFGYGTLNWLGKQHQKAHRISYQIHGGVLRASDVLRHSCDNPPCVNPAHLQPGSHAENMHDMHRRGRYWQGPRIRGERNPLSRLTEESVRDVRRQNAEGMGRGEIAEIHGVSRATIRNVLNGRTWGWVDSDALDDPEFAKSADPNLRKRAVGDRVPTRPIGTCSIDGCEKSHYARGWCGNHYARWKNHGDPEVFVRAFDDREKNRVCEFDGCDRKHFSKGYCTMHYQRLRKHGDANVTVSAKERRRGTRHL